MNFEFRLKGLNGVRLPDVSREVIPEEGGTIEKGPAARLLFNFGDRQEPRRECSETGASPFTML